MTESAFEPGDLPQMRLDAEKIVAQLLRGKEGLFAPLSSEPVEELSELLSVGQSPGEDVDYGADEWEDSEFLEEPDEFEADDEDIEAVMAELIEENPEFALVEESERREIVVSVINEVLAEGL